jgi:hypothetical protein
MLADALLSVNSGPVMVVRDPQYFDVSSSLHTQLHAHEVMPKIN